MTAPRSRAVEPALAAGALIVIGYGISERLLPGLLHFPRSVSAEGRLEQPLTYWNAMGELAALGFVLCARLAGDARRRGTSVGSRPPRPRAPLGMGLYLTLLARRPVRVRGRPRGAASCVAPRREQLRAIALTVAAGALAAARGGAVAAGSRRSPASLGTREREGAIALALLAVVIAAAALLTCAGCWQPSARPSCGSRAGRRGSRSR